MTSHDLLIHATTLALGLLIAAMMLSLVRLVRGPTLPDRILTLDTLNTLGIGLIGTIAIRTGISLYLDIAIALALVGFLSTVALARYLLQRHLRQVPES
jgi:multicomponent Na+:H+ antiporter subunit F